MSMPSIAIVGGGFSGLSVAAHLIFNSNTPFSLYLIERSANFAKGTAYSTLSPVHLLNVRAKGMGALKDQPEHFWSWIQKNASHPAIASLELHPDHFFPRAVYALYLADLFQEMQQEAARKGIELHVIRDEAIDADLLPSQQISLALGKDTPLLIDFLVLALGVPTFRRLSFESQSLLQHPGYTANPWNLNETSILCQKNPSKTDSVLIIGSGLTAVDTICSLAALDWQGQIYCVSPRGTFPQAHQEKAPAHPIPPYSCELFPSTTLKLFKDIKIKLLRPNQKDIVGKRSLKPLDLVHKRSGKNYLNKNNVDFYAMCFRYGTITDIARLITVVKRLID